MEKEELEDKLIVGTKIRIGKEYVANNGGFDIGEIIELVDGEFERYNGLYDEIEHAPSIWDENRKEYDSIYHLFGNNLEDFMDCEIINTP